MEGEAAFAESNGIDYTPEQADALYDAVQSRRDPQTALTSIDGGKGNQATPAAPQPAQAFEKKLVWNGKEITVNDPAKYDLWASQGYDYSQRMAQLKVERENWEKEISGKQQTFSRYEQIDSYVKQNPSWWEFVEQQWQNRDQNELAQNIGVNTSTLDPNIQTALAPIMSELTELKKFYNEVQRQKVEQEVAAADHALLEEIAGLQKSYPEVDFQGKDPSGQSLEALIVNHANARGIPTFSAAFYDYYQGNLQKIYEQRGRKQVEAEMAKRKEQGIIGQSRTPQTEMQANRPQPGELKSKSYEQLLHEELMALGLR